MPARNLSAPRLQQAAPLRGIQFAWETVVLVTTDGTGIEINFGVLKAQLVVGLKDDSMIVKVRAEGEATELDVFDETESRRCMPRKQMSIVSSGLTLMMTWGGRCTSTSRWKLREICRSTPRV